VARNVELARVAKEFDVAAAEAKETASQIRLEKSIKALNALNQGVLAIKELQAALETGTDEELIASLDKALVAAQEVRSLLEKT
jgi:hypothetical protein